MPRLIPPSDYRVITETEQLGADGCSQVEIAARQSLALTSLRNTLEKHGLEMVSVIQVRSKIGGKTLQQLLEDGDIAVNTDGGYLVEAA